MYYNIDKQGMTDEINLAKFSRYAIEVENFVKIILEGLNNRCAEAEKLFYKYY